jgi:Cu(I)/Ag(I) efflux system membrane fusion protein
MKRNNIINSRYIRYILLVLAGLFLGWLFFHPSNQKNNAEPGLSDSTSAQNENATIWTCAMHPQIRMDHPGKCPICGMDLIPLSQAESSSIDPDAVKMTKEAAALANVMTTVVGTQQPVKDIRLYGKVQVDERNIQSQVAHVSGRIDKLTVNFTGETVKRGQVLAEIYSPELITAQQELIETAKTKQLQPDLYEASRERLRQWKLSDEQINEIESSGKTMSNIRVLSNTSGTIVARRVNTGDHVDAGTVLYDIADLSRVWIQFDAYESDLPFLSAGKKIKYTVQALPGSEFSGNIAFIDPVIDPVTRVARVRVEASNPSGKLKPEMFATGIVSSDLSEYKGGIVIPSSAVLWTGKRSIVYVKQPGDEMIFKMRELELGPALGDSYVVTSGLSQGEEIVTNGTFSVDASAQLEGKPSMMNPTGGSAPAIHHHDDMSMQSKAGDENTHKDESSVNPGVKPDKMKQQDTSSDKTINTQFKNQLGMVYDNYINLKNALVKSDPGNASSIAKNLLGSLSQVDMKILTGEAHMKWMDISGSIEKSTGAIASSNDIESQRKNFSSLSDLMYKAVKTFGLTGKTVYYQFCPMYGGGAYWLSETDQIRNPYYGDQMLTCGENRETLK